MISDRHYLYQRIFCRIGQVLCASLNTGNVCSPTGGYVPRCINISILSIVPFAVLTLRVGRFYFGLPDKGSDRPCTSKADALYAQVVVHSQLIWPWSIDVWLYTMTMLSLCLLPCSCTWFLSHVVASRDVALSIYDLTLSRLETIYPRVHTIAAHAMAHYGNVRCWTCKLHARWEVK